MSISQTIRDSVLGIAGMAAVVGIVWLVLQNVSDAKNVVAIFGVIGTPVAAVIGAVLGNTAGKAAGEQQTRARIKADLAGMPDQEQRLYIQSMA